MDYIDVKGAVPVDTEGKAVGGTIRRYFHEGRYRITGWEQLDNCDQTLPCRLRHNPTGPSPCDAMLRKSIVLVWRNGNNEPETQTVSSGFWCGKAS